MCKEKNNPNKKVSKQNFKIHVAKMDVQHMKSLLNQFCKKKNKNKTTEIVIDKQPEDKHK